MREKPENLYSYNWEEFEIYADENSIGEHPDDWEPWWDCWKRAYGLGTNES